MKHYYITDNTQPKGFIELTEDEWNAIVGTDGIRPYANQVYRGIITLDEVPEELSEDVQTVVNNKIAKWGEYKEQEVSATEFQSMIEEVL